MDASLPRDTIFGISRKTQVKLNFIIIMHTITENDNFSKQICKNVLQNSFVKIFFKYVIGET